MKFGEHSHRSRGVIVGADDGGAEKVCGCIIPQETPAGYGL